MIRESRDPIEVRPGIADRICESGHAAGGLPNQRSLTGNQRTSATLAECTTAAPKSNHRAAVHTPRLVDAGSIDGDGCRTRSRRVDYFTPAKLEALVAVAEQGSLSAAARSLHISQPALSQTIGGLERRLGTKLFVRTSTGVTTTRAGRAVLSEARTILDRHDRLLQVAAGCVADEGGALRLSIPFELPVDVLGALAKFAAEHPATRLRTRRLTMATQLAGLHGGALDVSFMNERPPGHGLHSMLLAREHLGVLVSRSVAARVAGPQGIRLETLAGLEWLGFPRSSSPAWHDRVAAVLRTHGIDPDDGEGRRDDFAIPSVVYTAVSGGHAFALAPAHWSHPVTETVTWIPLVDDSVVRSTWAVWYANCRRGDVAQLIQALETCDSTTQKASSSPTRSP
jgi:DNA-binding transcriptional LysR family regulator